MWTFKDLEGNPHKVKIPLSFEWTIDYLMAVRHFIPVWKIKEIKGYKVSKYGVERQKAACIAAGNRYVITLLSKTQTYKKTGKARFKVDGWEEHDADYNFECTLDSLAHELSHLVEWNHTAERFILEKRIAVIFARLAKKLGYTGYAD